MVYSHPKHKQRDINKISSQRKKKKEKENYMKNTKTNYKRKKSSQVECCICFGQVDNTSDNSINCGKTTHFMCGECKFRCNETGNDKCPMCRSHPIKNPIARDINLLVYSDIKYKNPKSPSLNPTDSSRMSIKQRRNYFRKSSTYAPFHQNTNRIIRQTTGWTSRPTSWRLDYDGLVPANRIFHSNHSDYFDSEYSESDTNSSDTESQFSYTSDSDASDTDIITSLIDQGYDESI